MPNDGKTARGNLIDRIIAKTNKLQGGSPMRKMGLFALRDPALRIDRKKLGEDFVDGKIKANEYFERLDKYRAGVKISVPGLRKKAEREIDAGRAPRFNPSMVKNPDGKWVWNGLSAPSDQVEHRANSPYYGSAIPAIYSAHAFRRVLLPSNSYTEDDFRKYFTEYANKIRPKNLSIRASGDPSMSGGHTGGKATIEFGGWSLGSNDHSVSPSTAVHELTHTMQPNPSGLYGSGLGSTLMAAEFEVPATLAGTAVDAIKSYKSGGKDELLGLRSFGEAKNRGWEYPAFRSHFAARQAANHMYGKDIETWRDIGQAKSMNELLDTKPGRDFVSRIGTPRVSVSPVDDGSKYSELSFLVNRASKDMSEYNKDLESRRMLELSGEFPSLNFKAVGKFLRAVNPSYPDEFDFSRAAKALPVVDTGSNEDDIPKNFKKRKKAQ